MELAGISARVSNNNSTGENPNHQYEVTAGTNTGAEEGEPSVDGNDDNMISITVNDNSNVHNSIGGNGRNTARLQDPKAASYFLRYYLLLLAIVCVKLTGGNPLLLSNIANPFMFFSLVAFCMALLVLSQLSWLFEHSEETSGTSFHYKVLKGIYYMFCNLAYFSLLPVLIVYQ